MNTKIVNPQFETSSNKVSEAKVIKLSTSHRNVSPKSESEEQRIRLLSSTPKSTISSGSNSELNVTKAMDISLYVIRDFDHDRLIYGSLRVSKGEYLKLICDSDEFYFVENSNGEQGYIPIEVAVDMDEVYKRVQRKQMNNTMRITSL